MKKTFLAVFLFPCFYSFSQTDFRFADSTAQWNVLETQYCISEPCIYWQTHVHTVLGDTIIGGMNYQIIRSDYSSLWNYYPFVQKVFVRKDSLDRVFARTYSDSTDFMIYDFSKVAGDTYSIRNYNSTPDSISFVVDSVATFNWGRNRKVMYVTASGLVTYNDVLVEGIGSLYTYFLLPGGAYFALDGPAYGLLCFFEKNILIYHDSTIANCVLDSSWVEINEISKGEVNVSPNPANSYIIIQSSENFPANTTFQLFDITGRMVLQKQLNIQTTQIELSGVSKGMYLYNVVSDKERLGAGKLVIE